MIPIPSFAQSAGITQAVARADVAYIKHRNPSASPKIGNVAYKAGYALTSWTNGEAGGEDVFHYQRGAWHFIGGGGGVMDAASMGSLYHVPPSISKDLVSQMVSSMAKHR